MIFALVFTPLSIIFLYCCIEVIRGI
jgi:hypothetical protein